MSRRSKHRWLIVPAFFILSVYLFVHYSIRLDNTTSSQLIQVKDGYDLSSVPKKKGNHLIKGPSTVTVTVKETVTLYHDSPEAVLHEEPDSKHMCDPYMTPGYFAYKGPGSIAEMTYTSLNPDSCSVFSPSIITRLLDSTTKKKSKESALSSAQADMFNKTVVIFGDEIDRNALVYLCNKVGGELTISKQESHMSVVEPRSDEEPLNGLNGAHTRRCYMAEHQLSISHYMLYGVSVTEDADSIDTAIIPDSIKVIQRPFTWSSRLNLGLSAYKTLSLHEPDLVFVGAGLWDLAYFAKSTEPASLQLSHILLDSYSTNLDELVAKIKDVFPSSRVVIRDTLFPQNNMPAKSAFGSLKIEQLNSAAQSVAVHNQASFWPIGQLSQSLPADQLYIDGVHLNKEASIALLGQGILEYVARTHSGSK